MLQPVVRRPWAPRGETPNHDNWDRRDRFSPLSSSTASRERRRLGLCFDICDHNIVTDDFETFLETILPRLRHPIILVMDRWQVHRAGALRPLRSFPMRVEIERLPADAPDISPVGQIWDRTKYTDLANYIPDDIVSLGRDVARSICQ